MNTRINALLVMALTTSPSISNAITVNPMSVDFKDVVISKTATVKLSLKNNTKKIEKNLALNINEASFIKQVDTCPTALNPGQSCTWTISFKPSTTGPKSASAKVTTSLGAATVTLAGVGVSGQPSGEAGNLLPAGTNGTKWYPGHYQFVKLENMQRADLKAVLSHPKMRGYWLMIPWSKLEGPQKGAFHFEELDAALKLVGDAGKKLHIAIGDRSFGSEPLTAYLPQYLHSEGCTFLMANQHTADPNDVKGSALKWYKPQCVDHLIDLYAAMAKKYNLDKRLASLTMGRGESALEVAKQSDYTSHATHVEQILRAGQEVKGYFRNTVVATGLNYLAYTKSTNPKYENGSYEYVGEGLESVGGSAFTHPDTVPGKYFPATYIEIDFKGRVPTLAQLQPSQLPPSMPSKTVFDWATKTIGASSVVWPDYVSGVKDYVSARTVPFLNSSESTVPVSNLACPTTLVPCITN